jgi:hypothetical protein
MIDAQWWKVGDRRSAFQGYGLERLERWNDGPFRVHPPRVWNGWNA